MDDLQIKLLLKENQRYAGVAQPFHFDAMRNDAEAFNLELHDASYQAIKDDARLNAARVQLLVKAMKKSIERHSMYFGNDRPATLTILEHALKEAGLEG